MKITINWMRSARLFLTGAVLGANVLLASPAWADRDFLCTAAETALVVGSRIHVRCDPGDGAINFFALSISNPDTSRALSLFATAVAARRPLFITYDPNDPGGAAIGCLNTNCRLIKAIVMEQK